MRRPSSNATGVTTTHCSVEELAANSLPVEPQIETISKSSDPSSPTLSTISVQTSSLSSLVDGVKTIFSSPSSTLYLIASIAFYLLVLSISSASTKVVDEWGHTLRHHSSRPHQIHHSSSDLGRNLLPHVHAPWLPDLLIVVLLFICTLAFIWPNPHGRHHVGDRRKRLAILLFAHASILIMRTSTTVVTVHPVSSPFCSSLYLKQAEAKKVMDDRHEHLQQQNAMGEEEIGFLLNTGCYDMMFSGHVSFSVLVALFCLQAPNLPISLKFLSGLLTFGSIVGNIAVGDHYSSDVLVGSYISFLVFMLFRKPILKTYVHHNTSQPQSSDHGGP